jgi:hypothetical protein
VTILMTLRDSLRCVFLLTYLSIFFLLCCCWLFYSNSHHQIDSVPMRRQSRSGTVCSIVQWEQLRHRTDGVA